MLQCESYNPYVCLGVYVSVCLCVYVSACLCLYLCMRVRMRVHVRSCGTHTYHFENRLSFAGLCSCVRVSYSFPHTKTRILTLFLSRVRVCALSLYCALTYALSHAQTEGLSPMKCRDKFLIGICNIVARASTSYRRAQFRQWSHLVMRHQVHYTTHTQCARTHKPTCTRTRT